jgi:hypothetical protein
MRTSSIKAIVAALSISFTVLAAVPSADARPAKAQKSQTTRAEAAANDRFAGLREAINSVLRRIGIQTGATIPIPKSAPDTDQTGATIPIPDQAGEE